MFKYLTLIRKFFFLCARSFYRPPEHKDNNEKSQDKFRSGAQEYVWFFKRRAQINRKTA